MGDQSNSAGWRSRIVGHGAEPPEHLLANPHNWRIHPKAQQDALSSVLSDVGWVQSVVVNRNTGHVVDGHLRVSLAISREEPQVPVVYVELDEAEEALVLASLDPLAGMAVTDQEKLAELMAAATVSSDELAETLRELAGTSDEPKGGQTDPDDVPEPRATEIQAGDLFELGDHRLLCGDSTKAEDVARVMDGATVSTVLTDPPYGMNLNTDWSQAVGWHGGKKHNPVIGDDVPFDPSHMFPFDGEMFLWGADYYAERIPARNQGSWLVWDKRTDSQAGGIGSEFELCWSRVRHKRRTLRHEWFGFFGGEDSKEAQNRLHPTQKPTSLIVDILKQWGGDTVVDYYAGSGTTIIAAEQLGRKAYAIEIEPSYCQVTIDRWEAFTGQTATKVGEAVRA